MAMRRACEYMVSRALASIARDGGAGEGGDAGRRFVSDARAGAFALENVELDVDAIASLGGGWTVKIGVELVMARVGGLTVRIPWEAIGRESCSLEARDVSVKLKCVGAGETEVFEAFESAGEATSKASMVVRKVLNALCKGLRARMRELRIVVLDANGVGKLLVRLEVAEYTHGVGVLFEGLSVQRISTGLECSASEALVRDVRGRVQVPSDFSRIEVELEEVEANASVSVVKSVSDLVRARGLESQGRVKVTSHSRSRRTFIDDILTNDLSASGLSSIAYEEARDDMGDSVYEDSNEEFFDADEVAREMSESAIFDEDDVASTSNGNTVIVLTCPKFSLHAPFDETVCTLTLTEIVVDSSNGLDTSWADLRFIYGFDDDNHIDASFSSSSDDAVCGMVVQDDCLSVKLGHFKASVNGVQCLSSLTSDAAASASIYWLDDPLHPMDGSLPRRCVSEVRDVETANGISATLREQLANDASLFLKVSVPCLNAALGVDAIEALSAIVQSMYELPDNHLLALRTPTPDSILSPLVVALEVGAMEIQLVNSSSASSHISRDDFAASEESSIAEARVLCEFQQTRCFLATNIAGSLGSDFAWAQFRRARATVDGMEVLCVNGPVSGDSVTPSSFAFARMEGEQTCVDANIVRTVISVTQCEPLIERLNNFIPVTEGEISASPNESTQFALRLFNSSFVRKLNDSFGVLCADFLRVNSKQGDSDEGTVGVGAEVYCGETTGYVVPPGVKDIDGLQMLVAFPFTHDSMLAEGFAPIFKANAMSLTTLASTSNTAIANIRTHDCTITLHKDTLQAVNRLLTPDIECDDRPGTPDSCCDENEYVFVSPAKKKSGVVHARYGSDITETHIADATRDQGVPPKARTLGSIITEGRQRPLLSRSTNTETGPNVIENFFYRDTRRVRRKRAQPLFASGSVSGVRRRSSIRVRIDDMNATIMSQSRFAGEFGTSSVHITPRAMRRVSPKEAPARYLPLPKDAVVPQSTVHLHGKAFEVCIRPVLFWSPVSSPRHADSVETDPLGSSAGIKLSLRMNTARIDSFPPHDGDATHRIACSVRDVLCTDITSGATWPNVLKYDASSGEREERADMCLLDVTAYSCRGSNELEYVVKASSLPLHVKLDQRVVKLLLDVFANEIEPSPVMSAESEDTAYFQKIEVGSTSLRLDYCGRQLDIDALRSGNLLEVLNLVPWDGVSLNIEPIRLTGISGVANAMQAVITRWLEDVTRTQAGKFVQGVKPIKSATNIGRRAMGIVKRPLDYHRNNKRGGFVAGFALGVASFVKEVSLSSMELGAFAAGQSAALLDAAEHMIEEHSAREADDAEPTNILQGLSLASKAAWRGAGRAATAVIVEPIRDYRTGDVTSSSAFLGAVRKVPYATVTGAKGFSKAIDHALSGAIASARAVRAPPSPTQTVDDVDIDVSD